MAEIISITSRPAPSKEYAELQAADVAFRSAPKDSPAFFRAADRITDAIMAAADPPAKSRSEIAAKALAVRILLRDQIAGGGIFALLESLLDDLDPAGAGGE